MLTRDEAIRLRLRSQRLHPDTAMADVHDLAANISGFQAQDVSAGTLSFQPRSTGITAADVDRARNTERTIVRTWVMRNTLHFIAAEDVHWLLGLLSPRSTRRTRRRREQLGLSEAVVERGIGLIYDLLKDGPLPRAELLANIGSHGIPVDGQAGIHLLARAALEGVVCYGPDVGNKLTFVLLDQWLQDAAQTQPTDPLVMLAQRYLTAYAPAAPEDFAQWAGITLTDARAGFAGLGDTLFEVNVEGEPAWLLEAQIGWLETPDERTIVRFLPAFDIYLLGWRSRDSILSTSYSDRIHPGGGILHPSVMINGRIVGRWKSVKAKAVTGIVIEPFEPLGAAILDALRAEGQNLGYFLGTDVKLTVENM
jgi:hypothetical protein